MRLKCVLRMFWNSFFFPLEAVINIILFRNISCYKLFWQKGDYVTNIASVNKIVFFCFVFFFWIVEECIQCNNAMSVTVGQTKKTSEGPTCVSIVTKGFHHKLPMFN